METEPQSPEVILASVGRKPLASVQVVGCRNLVTEGVGYDSNGPTPFRECRMSFCEPISLPAFCEAKVRTPAEARLG